MNYDPRNDYPRGGGGNSRAVAQAPASRAVAPPEFAVTDLGSAKLGRVALVPTSVGEIMQFANMMANSKKMVRKHLRGEPETCLAIAMQAFRWGMDPFMVASASFEVNDQIAYEAKLLNAVIIQNAPIVGRPVYTYTGEGANRRCKVTVKTTEGQELSLETPPKGQIKPQNSPLWQSDPDQQLSYYSIRALARRSFPDILMGCYDIEEAESMRDVTPPSEQPAPAAAPGKSRATAALDALQGRRGKAPPPPVAEIDGSPDVVDPESDHGSGDGPEHDEDGVINGDDDAYVGLAEEDVDEPGDAPAVQIPEMPADTLALWEGKGRWSPAWKWLAAQADAVDQQVLAHLLMTHRDVIDAAAAHNDAGKQAASDLKKKAGLE